MKVAIIIGSTTVGGGVNVIFEHAYRLTKNGHDIWIISNDKVDIQTCKWHDGAAFLKFATYDEIVNDYFDIAVCTYWRSAYDVYKINARQYAYFVQSIESRFFPASNYGLRFLADTTYTFPMPIITEATWIQEYLKSTTSAKSFLVKNGIRKDIFTTEGDSFPKEENKLRVLVEGPVDVSYKNIPKTIELVNASKADEIWLLTSSDISEYKNVDRVFSKISPAEVAKLYRSCDVIVKLSYVEGMFGPPLEMFHCKGTCIVYDVTGHDEYIINGFNGIVVKTDNEQQIIEEINSLKNDKLRLNTLKENGLKTANEWNSWEKSSQEFEKALSDILKLDPVSKDVLFYQTCLFMDIYGKYEESIAAKPVSRFRTSVGKIIYKISPKLNLAIYKMINKRGK